MYIEDLVFLMRLGSRLKMEGAYVVTSRIHGLGLNGKDFAF